MRVTNQVVVDLHRRMVRLRLFDEACAGLDKPWSLHSFFDDRVAREPVLAGVCAALTAEDRVGSTQMAYQHVIGRVDAVDHTLLDALADIGSDALVGAGVPAAVGAAFASKYRDATNVVVVFVQDHATNTTEFHEATNLAVAMQLPVVLVCEKTHVAPTAGAGATPDLVDRAAGYALASVVVDGGDPLALYEAALHAISQARLGHGPVLIQAKTYSAQRRQSLQLLGGKTRDELSLLETHMDAMSVQSLAESQTVRAEVTAEIAEALADLGDRDTIRALP